MNTKQASAQTLASCLIQGDKRTLAICISLIESLNREKQVLGEQVLQQIQNIQSKPPVALRIGITGAGGAGKSTLVNALGSEILKSNIKLAVLTIDPTSSLKGGSLLGDATRMGDIASHPSVFLRSSPSGSQAGGVAKSTAKAIQFCELAGFDIIVVESVGSGQIEFELRHSVDYLYWLTMPGAGDDLQAMKQGVLEWVDGIFINQADRSRELLAQESKLAYEQGLALNGQQKLILTVSALDPLQVKALWLAVQKQIEQQINWSLMTSNSMPAISKVKLLASRQTRSHYRQKLSPFNEQLEDKLQAIERLNDWLEQRLNYSYDWLADFMPQLAQIFDIDTVQMNWQGACHHFGPTLSPTEFSRLSLALPPELFCQFNEVLWHEHYLPLEGVIFIPLTVVPTDLTGSERASISNPDFRFILGYRYRAADQRQSCSHKNREFSLISNRSILYRQWTRALQAVFFEAELYALQHAIRPKNISLSDELTGLANREAFCAHLDQLLLELLHQPQEKWQDRAVYVYAIDIDDFRRINEVLGLDAGDRLLCLVADVLSGLIAEDDLLARFGGDEFFLCKAFLIEAVDESDQLAQAFGCRLQDYLNAAVLGKMPAVSRIQCHIGCVAMPYLHSSANQVLSSMTQTAPETSWNTNEVLRAAGAALYAAKSVSPDGVYMYDARMRQGAHRHFAIKHELFQAMAEEQFTYLAQPLVNQRSNEYIGAELLLRWHHPSRGILAASEFIESATGLGILQKNDLRLIFKDLTKIVHIAQTHDVIFHLNLSAQLFFDEDIIDFAIALEKRGALPYLHFEITEHAFVNRLTLLHQFIYRVRAGGSQVWLDDFGVGYSGLRYLDALEIDGVKIDQSFVRRLDRPRTRTLVEGMLNLLLELDLAVLAEGVEEEHQAQFLTGLGCELQQGLLYGAAMPFTEFVALLETNKKQ